MTTRIPAGHALGITLALVLALAPPAHAGGFEIPDNGTASTARGGAFTVKANDPTAIAHNPGGLSRLDGTNILLNETLTWRHVTFTRAPTSMPETLNYGSDPLAPVENQKPMFPLGLMFAATSDFGLDDWTFGVGVYGPSASGAAEYPRDGGQRYMLTGLESTMLYFSAAIAYGHEDCFGVGLTLQYVMAPEVKMRMVVDGSPFGALNPYYSGNDVEAILVLSDMASFSALLGGWWRPIPELEVALSGRVVPIYLNTEGTFGLQNVPGQTVFTDDRLHVTDSKAQLDLVLPPTARLGVRYRFLDDGAELFDLELDVVYEAWSMLERYHVKVDGIINLFAGAEAPDVIIEKRWQDTVSVRLGGTWNILGDNLGVSMGGFWESGAVPANYEHLDFLSFDRFGLGLGVNGKIGPIILTAAYQHVFQEDRTVTEEHSKVYQVRALDPCPEACDGGKGWSGVPANAGTFESSYDMLSLGIQASF